MPNEPADLYALLGVNPSVSASQIRKAYEWAMTTEASSVRRRQIQRAYSVLGDPRMRIEYDRGQAVGVGYGQYHHRREPDPLVGTSRPRDVLPRRASMRRLEDKFHRRWDARTGLTCDQPPVRKRFWIALTALGGVPMLVGLIVGANNRIQHHEPDLGVQALQPVSPRPYGWPTGSCLLEDAQGAIGPNSVVPCAQPHQVEVVAVVDYDRVLGRPPATTDEAVARQTCGAEFVRYTGLPAPTATINAGQVQTVSGPTEAWLTCLAMSDVLRIGSVRGVSG